MNSASSTRNASTMPKASSTSNVERDTIAYYDRHAAMWIRGHCDPLYWSVEMAQFQSYLGRGLVLDAGCGAGRDAAALRQAGFDYVGIDASARMIQAARGLNPGMTFLRQNVLRLDFPSSYFDGLWCVAMLLHLTRKRLPEALHELHRVVRPNGVGFVSVKEGEGEGAVTNAGRGPHRFFSYYREAEFARTLNEAGFAVREVRRRRDAASGVWLGYLVSRGRT
jgi:SAM-dependent methyltransferase